MLSIKLSELFGNEVSPEIGEEELRIAYQVGEAPSFPEEGIRNDLSRQLALPLEVFRQAPIEVTNGGGHIITLLMKDRRVHVMVLLSDVLANKDAHRRWVAHELSHLFRIVTGESKDDVRDEESAAETDADALRFDFGDLIRKRFLDTH